MIDQDDIDLIIESAQEDMQGALDHLTRSLQKIRTGKASPAILEGIVVPYYGAPTPLKQVATVNIADSRTLNIQPFEKSIIPAIEKSIMESNLGFNPQNDGERILIMIPPLTEERRKQLAKQAKDEGENAKITIRSARRSGMDEAKKAVKNGYPEDAGKNLEKTIDDLTKDFSAKVEAAVKTKEGEIMQV